MKRLAIILIIIVPILHSCTEIFDWDKTKTELLTDKQWGLSIWRFKDVLDTITGKDVELDFEESILMEIIFYDNGTYKGTTPGMYFSNQLKNKETGNWSLNENTNSLMLWDAKNNRDTLTLVSVNDSLLELQLSEYQSTILFKFTSLVVSIDNEGLNASDFNKPAAVIWIYKNIGEVENEFEEETTSFTDVRDGNVYKTVTIGNQTWMAENLAYLPQVYSPLNKDASYTDPRYYVYGYNGYDVASAKATNNYKEYGALYNWPAARAACPEGWRLPTYEDWEILQEQLGGQLVAGGKMKEKGFEHWLSPNTNGTDEVGFTALPGGFRANASGSVEGGFRSINEVGFWWSATAYDAQTAWRRDISYNMYDLALHNYHKEHGYSVRCIKDENSNPNNGSVKGRMKDPRDGFEYNTIKIGNQIWMADNLAFLPYILYGPEVESYNEPMSYVYDMYNGDDETAVTTASWKTYGTLYNWTMAQNVCPNGWILPSKNDWEILATEVGGKSVAGKALKEEGATHWGTANAADNSSGFTALPGGFVYTQADKFADQGNVGAWWTSTEESVSDAYRRDLSHNQLDLGEHVITKSHGYSVRCLKIPVEGETMVDTRDGNEYKIVKIGNQVWMAENLAYIPFNEEINYPTDQRDQDEIPKSIQRYFVYDYYYPHRKNALNDENYKTYGVLYNWYAAANVCPAGWHLPSNDEWKELANTAGGKELAGKALKVTGNEYWMDYSTPVNNSTGFSALPGGMVDKFNLRYVAIGMNGNWWTSTEYGTASAYGKTYAYKRDLSYNQTDMGEHNLEKTFGLSVRCVKD